MKIGVFDSGIGGEAVARDLRRTFVDAEVISISDRKNLPYGSKMPEQIRHLVDNAIQPLLATKCDVIVIACNTATTIALPMLRKRYPRQVFIGIEPMIKTAANQTKSGVICVCATPATLSSTRYHYLKQTFGKNALFIEPDCHDWAEMIEKNEVNIALISRRITQALEQRADIIVLGCTHYHWIQDIIETITAGRATILEPTEAIARRIRTLLPDA